MYTEYRPCVCSSIFSSALLNPCEGKQGLLESTPGEHAKPELESSFEPVLLLSVDHTIFHHRLQVIVISGAIYVPSSFMLLVPCSTATNPKLE